MGARRPGGPGVPTRLTVFGRSESHPVRDRVQPAPQHPRVQYVSYDGVLEPLGESQVVGYLERLSPDFDVTLLSFEKRSHVRDAERLASMERRLRGAGIRWVRLRYHKAPPLISTAFDVLRGCCALVGRCWTRRPDIWHARGYVSALVALIARRFVGGAFLFDMRGFWADEKADAEHWSRRSAAYRSTKWLERWFFQSADGIVSLTQVGLEALDGLGYRIPQGIPVDVIPTCANLQRFTPGPKSAALVRTLGLSGQLVIGCVGTMSNWYLRVPMLEYAAFLIRRLPDVAVLIVTREDHDQLRADARRQGIDVDRLVITRAPFDQMPEFIRLMDLGMFFIKPTLSKKGSAATKLAEFLACGVPVVINDGVGDSGAIVRERQVGVVLPALDAETFERTLERVTSLVRDEPTRRRCRVAAADVFDLNRGAAKYRAVYRAMLERADSRPRDLTHA